MKMINKGKKRLDNKKYKVNNLKWDTDYFGVNSGRVDLFDSVSDEEYEDIKKKICEYKFVTIVNHGNININNEYISKLENVVLRDVNVQLTKKSEGKVNGCANVNISNKVENNEKLLQICRDSFVYSRFFNDTNLSQEKSKDMYYNWLKNSFKKEDKYICVYSECGVDLGFLLFSYDKDKSIATIELIAVDKQHSKNGIGKELMNAFEHYVNDRKIRSLEVGTQLNNVVAQNFYISCGYRIANYNSIYHVWRK